MAGHQRMEINQICTKVGEAMLGYIKEGKDLFEKEGDIIILLTTLKIII